MLRITTGTAKNKRLKAPNVDGFRGVQEIAKGALFSIIGEKIKDSTCLDLFAGSGNLGIEALSRGANWCDFVDENRNAVKTILENLNNSGLEEKAEVHQKDAVKYAANTENKYDYIFMDPFYHSTHHIFLMENIEEILKPDGMVTFFHSENQDIEKFIEKTKLKIVDTRRFGKSFFSILEH